MKLKLLTSLFLFLSVAASAQWTQRAGFPGTPRAKSVSFTINDKVYVIGGVTNASAVLRDVWEYDMASDTWTQKPLFPGPERYGAASFVINDKGYIATGGNDNGYLDDLWQYNPVTGLWTQETGLPVGMAQHENQRREAFAFAINGKGYLGGGDGFVFGPNGTSNYAFFDLWEYNPLNNSWTTKAGIPDFLGRNMAVGVAVNNKGYVGLGCDVWQSTNRTSLWEYDPVSDTWTSRSSFPSNFTTDATAFVVDSSFYVAGGLNISTIVLSPQIFAYKPSTNTWTALTSFTGGAIAGQVAASSSGRIFMGTGYNASVLTRNDWWEMTGTSGLETLTSTPAAGIIAYPSPVNAHLHVRSIKEISFIEMIDLNGQVVKKFGSDFDDLNTSELSPGMYVLAVHFTDGDAHRQRLVKTK